MFSSLRNRSDSEILPSDYPVPQLLPPEVIARIVSFIPFSHPGRSSPLTAWQPSEFVTFLLLNQLTKCFLETECPECANHIRFHATTVNQKDFPGVTSCYLERAGLDPPPIARRIEDPENLEADICEFYTPSERMSKGCLEDIRRPTLRISPSYDRPMTGLRKLFRKKQTIRKHALPAPNLRFPVVYRLEFDARFMERAGDSLQASWNRFFEGFPRLGFLSLNFANPFEVSFLDVLREDQLRGFAVYQCDVSDEFFQTCSKVHGVEFLHLRASGAPHALSSASFVLMSQLQHLEIEKIVGGFAWNPDHFACPDMLRKLVVYAVSLNGIEDANLGEDWLRGFTNLEVLVLWWSLFGCPFSLNHLDPLAEFQHLRKVVIVGRTFISDDSRMFGVGKDEILARFPNVEDFRIQCRSAEIRGEIKRPSASQIRAEESRRRALIDRGLKFHGDSEIGTFG